MRGPGSGGPPGGNLTCTTPLEANETNCMPQKAEGLRAGCKSQLYRECFQAGLQISSRGPNPCDNPTVANASTCNVEKAMTIGRTCARQLHADCDDIDLGFDPPEGDCSNVTASRETCSDRRAFSQAVRGKPWCWWRFRDVCRKFLADHPDRPSIPEGCTLWFDGCNMCKVKPDRTSKSCTKKYCYDRRKRPFCVQYASGKSCKNSRASRRPICKKVGQAPPLSPSPVTCNDLIASDMDTPDDTEVCRQAVYKCSDSDILQDCRYKKDQEETANCRLAAFIRQKRAHSKCCLDGKLSAIACKSFGGPNTLPDDCKKNCVADGKFKNDVKECVRCRGKGDLRVTDNKSDGKTKKTPFDPARVRDTIKEIGSKLNKVCDLHACGSSALRV